MKMVYQYKTRLYICVFMVLESVLFIKIHRFSVLDLDILLKIQ